MSYNIEITASGNNVNALAPFTKIEGILVTSGVDVASIVVYDALTQVGIPIATVKAPVQGSFFYEFEGVVALKTGLSVTVAGTAPKIYLTVS